MKIFAKSLIGALAIATSSFAFAGGSSGPVTNPFTMNSGQGYFFFNAGAVGGKPACSAASPTWAVDLSTPAGRSIQALVLTAYALGKSVSVTGTASCSVWSDRETVAYVWII